MPTALRSRRDLAIQAALLALGLFALWRLHATVGAAWQPPPRTWERVLLDPNTATADELSLLPGLGPARARALIAERQRAGPFRGLEDLERVPGLGPKTIAGIHPFFDWKR